MVGTVRSESTGDHLTHAVLQVIVKPNHATLIGARSVVQVHPIASDATAEGGQRKMLH